MKKTSKIELPQSLRRAPLAQKIKYLLKNSPTYSDSDVNSISRKSRRRFVVEKRVDLHGLTTIEAFNKLEQFFDLCQRENVRNVLVITGGNSVRNSVLRQLFQEWAASSLRNFIASYSSSQAKDGGEGAFYVKLKIENRRF